jgi:hypothetical protein
MALCSECKYHVVMESVTLGDVPQCNYEPPKELPGEYSEDPTRGMFPIVDPGAESCAKYLPKPPVP